MSKGLFDQPAPNGSVAPGALLEGELRAMLGEIDELGEGLTKFEIGFVADMIDRDIPPARWSTKQRALVHRIHTQRVIGEAPNSKEHAL